MARQKHILVIGAGVIGLQTSISLLEAGYKVTIVANHLPGDTSFEYTSPWAAAMWRSNGLPEEKEIQSWDQESYKIWLQMCKGGDDGKRIHGVHARPMRLFWTGPHPFVPKGPSSIWYARHVDGFREIPQDKLPLPFKSGATHDGIAVNTTPYLKYLAKRIGVLGGRIFRAQVPMSGGLSKAIDAIEAIWHTSCAGVTSFDLVVNASGLGAHTLVPDPNVYPIRGQTVTVKGEAKQITTMFYPDENASITPRVGSGISVLGSTYDEGNWTPVPDPETTKKIVERCKPMAPELLNEQGEFDIVSVDVAFRPGRKGGPRVEIEEIECPCSIRSKKRVVCHTYGHAGGGFQNSFGSARKVLRLVDAWFHMEARSQARL